MPSWGQLPRSRAQFRLIVNAREAHEAFVLDRPVTIVRKGQTLTPLPRATLTQGTSRPRVRRGDARGPRERRLGDRRARYRQARGAGRHRLMVRPRARGTSRGSITQLQEGRQ